MDRVLECNGSITLVPRVKRRQGNEGHEGSMIHWMIADRIIREMGGIAPDGGLKPPDVPDGYKLPRMSEWMVDWAIRHVRETIPDDWSLMVEVPIAYEFDRFILSAHEDLLAISPDGRLSKGIDWKTGRDPVDPADSNEQVATYLTLQKRAWDSLEAAEFQIAQPRVDEEMGFERISTVSVNNLDVIVAGMERRVNAAIDNALEINSGRKQCAWCPVGIQCPALREELKAMKLKLTPESISLVKQVPDDALLGDWVITMRKLKRPTDDAEELLHERITAAGEVVAGNGTRITRKIQRGSYTIEDPVRFMEAVRVLLPSDDSIARSFTPSMTRIKDEIADAQKVPKTGSSDLTAENIFDAHLRPLVEQGERKILVFT